MEHYAWLSSAKVQNIQLFFLVLLNQLISRQSILNSSLPPYVHDEVHFYVIHQLILQDRTNIKVNQNKTLTCKQLTVLTGWSLVSVSFMDFSIHCGFTAGYTHSHCCLTDQPPQLISPLTSSLSVIRQVKGILGIITHSLRCLLCDGAKNNQFKNTTLSPCSQFVRRTAEKRKLAAASPAAFLPSPLRTAAARLPAHLSLL